MKTEEIKRTFEEKICDPQGKRKGRLGIILLLFFVVAYFIVSETMVLSFDIFTSSEEEQAWQKAFDDFKAYIPTALTLTINALLYWKKRKYEGIIPALINMAGALMCLPAVILHWQQGFWADHGSTFGLVLLLLSLYVSKEQCTGQRQENRSLNNAVYAIEKWLKNHLTCWWLWLIVTTTFLLTVQILFSIPAPCKLLDAVWEAGDIISLVGTFVLGYVTVHQTKKANDVSGQLMEIENTRHMLERRPFFMVVEYKGLELSWTQIESTPQKLYIAIGTLVDQSNIVGIELTLQNTTESFLTAQYHGGYSEKFKLGHAAVNQPNTKLYIQAGKNQSVVFYADRDVMKMLEGQRTRFEFVLENRFAERYLETFEVIVTRLSEVPPHKPGELYCSMFVQDYTIEKL